MDNPSPLSVGDAGLLPQVDPAQSQGEILATERIAERETISVSDFAAGVVENDWMWSNAQRIEASGGMFV